MFYIIGVLFKICSVLGIIFGAFGILYLGFYLMIRGLINLEGSIRTQKVWRVALKEYVEKRNPNVKRISMFNKPVLTQKDFEKKDGDN